MTGENNWTQTQIAVVGQLSVERMFYASIEVQIANLLWFASQREMNDLFNT